MASIQPASKQGMSQEAAACTAGSPTPTNNTHTHLHDGVAGVAMLFPMIVEHLPQHLHATHHTLPSLCNELMAAAHKLQSVHHARAKLDCQLAVFLAALAGVQLAGAVEEVGARARLTPVMVQASTRPSRMMPTGYKQRWCAIAYRESQLHTMQAVHNDSAAKQQLTGSTCRT